MRIGIFAKTFAAQGAPAALAAVRNAGYAVAHFNMAILGGAPMPDVISAQDCDAVALASRQTGVPIVAVSGTYNMIHPDTAMRAAGLARLITLIRAAPRMGVPLVTLCTGTRDPHDQWAHHPDNASAEAWNDLVAEMAKAIAVAEECGVDLGVEPELANVVSSAARARRLIDTMASPRVKIILDPANLFETGSAAEVRVLVQNAVYLLGDRIAMAHAKDRRADGAFATAGSGIVDFGHFVGALGGAGFTGPLVTHGLSEAEAPGVARFLRDLVSRSAVS